jgi:hypothetical protein
MIFPLCLCSDSERKVGVVTLLQLANAFHVSFFTIFETKIIDDFRFVVYLEMWRFRRLIDGSTTGSLDIYYLVSVVAHKHFTFIVSQMDWFDSLFIFTAFCYAHYVKIAILLSERSQLLTVITNDIFRVDVFIAMCCAFYR